MKKILNIPILNIEERGDGGGYTPNLVTVKCFMGGLMVFSQ